MLLYAFREPLGNLAGVITTFGSRWRVTNGQLVIGNTVNVALRAQSVQSILRSSAQALPESERQKAVHEWGRLCGSGFGEDLEMELRGRRIDSVAVPTADTKTAATKLKIWASYDSTTGMGEFEVQDVNFHEGRLSCSVELRHSFLAYRVSQNSPACGFIAGYLEGVVEHICQVSVSVTEVRCSAQDPSPNCRFEISAPSDG